MRKILLLCAMLSLPACAGRQSIATIPPAACSKLVPNSWAEGVEAAPIPDTTGMTDLGAVQSWAAAYVAMSGQLVKANGRTADAINIMTECEAMVNRARPENQ